MFPYPSGAGLHVGHPEGYTATDIIARYKRMKGFEVLHPMGWDAFGLPAENYAIKTGEHPEKTTTENIATFKRQIQSLGFSYDWSREFSTTDPEYYRWSQWIFLQMFKRGLLYEKEMPMNWCPKCRIVAANEEVENGCHERCGTEVETRNLTQWMFRITDYADRLLYDLDELTEWPEKIIAMQKNWIGRSVGCDVDWKVDGHDIVLSTFTTTVDTICGVTFAVISPEHPELEAIVTKDNQEKVRKYCNDSNKKSDVERTELQKNKSGVFTGSHLIHPFTKKKVPLYVADYVLMSYGTGVVMGVPAHDQRDQDFATRYNIPIEQSVELENGETFVYDDVDKYSVQGKIINSGDFTGLDIQEGREAIIETLEQRSIGKKKVQYKLRDWIFTRQRYWGEPIPLVRLAPDSEQGGEAGTIYPLHESELPITLPETDSFLPTEDGQSPLAKIRDWVEVRGDIQPDGTVKLSENGAQTFERETSTMPNWAGSNWYWLRFMDAQNEDEAWSKSKEEFWGPVDLYVGGAEHAVLHLLYSRFWHKVFYDMGLVSTKEPFKKLMNQGLILAEDGQKMSKSLGNVVNPDEIVEAYGADTLRVYEMFMGPFEQSKAWSTGSVEGTYKFLQRIWRLFQEKEITDSCPSDEFRRLVHKTVKKVTHDIEGFKFNTGISQMMILVNAIQKLEFLPKNAAIKLTQILSPFAPHLAEELWQSVLGNTESVTKTEWPEWDEALTQDDQNELAIQVNGKLRATISVSAQISKEDAFAQAKEQENVKKYLEEGNLVKEIYVPGKIVNLVVKD